MPFTPSRRAAAILVVVLPCTLFAQIPDIAEVPDDLPRPVRGPLVQTRTSLLHWKSALQADVANFNAECVNVAGHAAQSCRTKQDELQDKIASYSAAVKKFNDEVAAAIAACTLAAQQAQADRQEIERQMRTNEMSQEELGEWNKLNAKAQIDALVDGVKFVFGEFVADIDPVRGSVSRLERRAADLTQKATQSKKYGTRLKYLSQLNAVLDQLEPMQGNLLDKTLVKTGLDTEAVWNLARNTMKHEFRVARNQNQQMREVLSDPGFKEAFTGEDAETPGLDVFSGLVDEAVEEEAKFLVGLDKYERFTGPTIRAAVFVRDASYDALVSFLSTERVLQQSELAGALAKSAGALQKKYKKSVDALQACRAEGLAK